MGHEKGSFPGAAAKHLPGKFEKAEGGTRFLDENRGRYDTAMQASCARAGKRGEVESVVGADSD